MLKFAPLAFLLCAAPALATQETEPTSSQTNAAAEQPKAEKKVCRTQRSTGSMMPKRTCRTKAEWNAIDVEMQAQAGRNRVSEGITSMPTNR